MDMSPQDLRNTSFSTAKKGYDQSEVNTFLTEVATALEKAQNETAAMEARARAAVARLQELSAQSPESPPSGDNGAPPEATQETPAVHASPDDAETISRTLLLAQRTADATVADANDEAERVLSTARADATSSLEQARSMAEQLVEEAKAEARQAGEGERSRVEAEVQALMARRDFLESDVEHLEEFLIAQRERLREASASLTDIAERVPGGLGEMRKPLLSAASSTEADTDLADDVTDAESPASLSSDDTGEQVIVAAGSDDDLGDPDDAGYPATTQHAVVADDVDGGADLDPSVRPSGRVPLSFDFEEAAGDSTPVATSSPNDDSTRDDASQ